MVWAKNASKIAITCICALAVLSGCGQRSGDTPPPQVTQSDPYEVQNRKAHAFNKRVDQAVLRPGSEKFGNVVPRPVRRGVSNVSKTLALPGVMVNNLLQGDLEQFGTNFFRLAFNATAGIGGIFDPATALGIPEKSTDFGATLARWGAPEGAYQELPLLGPSTERDTLGFAVDLVLDPANHALPRRWRNGRVVMDAASGLSAREQYKSTVDSVLYDSADSYTQAKILYLQSRRAALGQSVAPGGDDPYDDPYYSDPYEDPYDQ